MEGVRRYPARMAIAAASTRRRLCATAVVLAVVVAACSTGGALERPGTAPATAPPGGIATSGAATGSGAAPAPESAAYFEAGSSYEWRRLPLGAGGWVTGLVIQASTGAMYARTDVGGAYRYDAAKRVWEQMLLASTVPGASATRDEYAVESIAVSPADARVVLVAVGGDENPGVGKAPPTTGRVLRSADGGRTWTAASTTFFVSGNEAHRQLSERLAFDPADPQHVLFGTRRQGLWESTDGGADFRQISTAQLPVGVPNRPEQDHGGVSFVSFDTSTPTRAYAGVAGEGVYRSDDRGRTWRRIATVAGGAQVPFEGTVTAGRLLVAINTIEGDLAGALRRYDPTTDAFTDITPPARASAWAAAVDPTNPQHLVAGAEAVSSSSLWRSVDGGKSWKQFDIAIDATGVPWLGATDLAKYMSIGRLVFDPKNPGRLWFAEGMGVWRTDDFTSPKAPSTITWHLDSRGIEELVVADVVVPPGSAPISVVADRQGLRSTSLTEYPTEPLVDERFAGGTDLDYSGRNPRALVWIGAEYNVYWNDTRVARGAISLDGGATWKELPNLTKNMFGGNVAVSATDPNNIVWLPSYFINPFEYANLGKGLYVTTNGGRSWQNKTVDGKNNFHRLMWWLSRQALASDKVDGGVFYLQNDSADFYVSTDGGVKWKKAANSAPCGEFNACHVYGQIIAAPNTAREVWSSVGEGGLYRSRDRGVTAWEKLPGVDDVHAFGFGAPLRTGGPVTVFLYGKANGDPQLGIWRSEDDGRTWRLLGRTPLDLYAKITTINGDPDHPGRVYVGFGGTGVAYGEDPALR